MLQQLAQLWRDEDGTATTESALVVAVIAVGTLGAIVGCAERMNQSVRLMGERLFAAGHGHAGAMVTKPG